MFSHYKWVEVISCHSWSDGAGRGEDEGVRKAALSGRGWGLSAVAGAASPFWAPCVMWPPAWGWMNAIFVSKANVFESELFPRPFQPSLSRPSWVSFASYRLPYWNAELQNTPADIGACQAHGETVMGPAWTLQGGRTWVPCQGAASFSSLLMNSSFELYVHRGKTDCVLSMGCSCLHPFTPIESNIVTLASFILSGQWSRATGENTAPLVLLVWFIIASFSPNCQRAACANPKEPVVITRLGRQTGEFIALTLNLRISRFN